MIKTSLTTIIVFSIIATGAVAQTNTNNTDIGETTEVEEQPQEESNVNSESQKSKPIIFTPPPIPDKGTPYGRQRGGASRSCRQTSDQKLTAIVPATYVDDNELVWGLTAAAYPSLWFYVPYSQKNSKIEFVLQDGDYASRSGKADRTIYQTTITADIPGLVQVTLPPEIDPLTVGSQYHWYFLYYCDADDPIFVEGWIERVSLSSQLQKQLQSAQPAQKINLYAENSLWFDTVTQFQQLLQANPRSLSLQQDWESLLNSVGLELVVE